MKMRDCDCSKMTGRTNTRLIQIINLDVILCYMKELTLDTPGQLANVATYYLQKVLKVAIIILILSCSHSLPKWKVEEVT